MWLASDITPDGIYRVRLCQRGRRRYFALEREGSLPAEDGTSEPVQWLLTEVVRGRDALRRRDFIGISESTRLSDGSSFIVDAHGIWLTTGELEALRRHTDYCDVPWVFGLEPQFPPK